MQSGLQKLHFSEQDHDSEAGPAWAFSPGSSISQARKLCWNKGKLLRSRFARKPVFSPSLERNPHQLAASSNPRLVE
jgi:hypothetical protein